MGVPGPSNDHKVEQMTQATGERLDSAVMSFRPEPGRTQP